MTLNWEKIRYFYEVSCDLNISKTAERLNISQPALSRHIRFFEENLGYPLFVRSNSGLLLTEKGKRMQKFAENMAAQAGTIDTLFKSVALSSSKKLKIETSVTLATMWFPHYLPKFVKENPHLRVSLEGVLDESLFLRNHESDVAISTYLQGRSDLVYRYLMTFSLGLYASPQYLKEHGIPKSIQDLKNHKLVGYASGLFHQYGDEINRVFIENRSSADSFIEINMGASLVTVASKGVGIIALSKEYPGLPDANLVRILPEISSFVDTFLVTPKERPNPTKAKLLYEYLCHELKDFRHLDKIQKYADKSNGSCKKLA